MRRGRNDDDGGELHGQDQDFKADARVHRGDAVV